MINFFKLGCFSTTIQVIIGAAGGHKKEWSQDRKDLFMKAQFYHFMCNAGLILYSFKQVSMAIPICFGAGISLFCVPLYHKAFTKEETLSSKLPPFGGMGMILGWLLFSVL